MACRPTPATLPGGAEPTGSTPSGAPRTCLQRVLLVLSDDTAADQLGGMLTDMLGAGAVTRVPDVETALPLLDRERCDAILLDVDRDDPPWAVALTLLAGAAEHVPVVALADAERELDALKAVKAGAEDYLLKGQLFPTLVERTLRYAVERHEAAGRLARSERYFRALIENASDIISIMDAVGTLRYLAPSVRKVLGFRPEDLVGHRFEAFLHPDDAELAQALLRGITGEEGRKKVLAELRFRHYDGSWRTFEVTLENRLDDPVVAGIVANARDATERKAAEAALGVSQEQLRQLQRIEAIGRLAGGVAHDFNNLLTAMSGHIYLLSADIAEDDPRRQYVDEIRRGAMRAAGLTRQLLAFSRKQVLRPRVLDLNAVVADVGSMLHRVIGEDIQLDTQLAQQLGLVRVDPSQIEQVLMNLVVNARDAMPEGGRLTIETGNADIGPEHPRRYHYVTPGPYVLLAVTDTGAGMDEAVRSRVFEPFFTTKEVGKGTGLGLSTVYGIVKQSGGFVFVDSTPGQGSRFEVYLPRATDAEGPDPGRTQVAAALAPGSETVLLVEDEDAVRSLAQHVLRRSGYNVLVARDGREAIELAEDYGGSIDLVVSDLVMPQAGGGEVAQQVLQHRPHARVLLISGYAPDALPVPPPGTAYEYLQKPFTPDVLTRKVRDVLDGIA